MTWINENKDWLFSGAGITALVIIWHLSKELYKLSWKYRKAGYFIPNSLSYFRHGELIGELVELKAKRIVSVHAVANKNVSIDYPVNTIGNIESAMSVSDPDTMQIIDPGQNTGQNSLEIKAKQGNQYIVASESTRSVSPYKENKKPKKENIVISSLVEKRLTTSRHDFVGARVIGKTNTQRIIVEFSESYKPDFLNVIQISKDGEVLKDENSKEFVQATHKNGCLCIVELHSPEPDSGIYIWWEWPTSS